MQQIVPIIFFGLTISALSASPLIHQLAPVPVRQVTIEDEFWAPKRKVWQSVTIPDCFAKFEKAGAIRNFEIIEAGVTAWSTK